MADDRGDPSAEAGADQVAARLAELHRRSEALAERMADFRSATEQLMRDAGGGNGAAAPGDDSSGEQPSDEPLGEQADQPADEPADEPAAPVTEPRRHRPRPSADAPLKFGDAEAPVEAASDALREPEPTPEPTPGPTPEPAPESGAKETPKDAPKDAPKEVPKAPAQPDDATKEKRPRRGMPGWVTRVRKLVITVVVIVAVAFALRTWVAAPFYVPSASMEPTLHGCPGCNDDHVLVQKLSYYFHDPRRGDIVVFDKPAHWRVDDSELIKRVIGTPGDKLVLRKGRVYVNGQKLDESYVNHKCRRGTQPENGRSSWTVPKNRLFVMGDNRCDSEDSRQFGMVPIDNVVGKAFLIYWPVGRFGSP